MFDNFKKSIEEEKPLTVQEIVVTTLYKERVGLIGEIAKTRANYHMALGKYTEIELENKKKEIELNVGSKKYFDLKATIERSLQEVKKWKKQLEELYIRMKGLEKANDEFMTRSIEDICLSPKEEPEIITNS